MVEQISFGNANIEFVDNPEPRVPCVLILDTSGSMTGKPIDELNEGVRLCKSELLADSLASKRVELAIVTFGGTVDLKCDFSTVDLFEPPTLDASGETPLGQAVNKAIDIVSDRKAVYKKNGVAYYRPWIFLITDGAPTDSWSSAASRVQEGERKGAFLFFSVGVEDADFGVLSKLSRQREPLKLKGLRFKDLFQWLSRSLTSVSQSKPNEIAKIENPVTASGWGEVPTGG